MSATLHIPAGHPAFEGHFPGTPLLPGVVLLDEMLRVVLDSGGQGWTIAAAKFLQPVRPGETLTFEHERLASGGVRFTIRSGERAVASGMLVPRAAADEPDHGHQAG
jgi:3-hydroxymyristoyl/3-hydroxydecanoyl-(acyl carrier protein) dehydratase